MAVWINEANWPEAWDDIYFSPIVVGGEGFSVYVGGYNIQKFYRYNLGTKIWTELATPPVAISNAISMSPDETNLAVLGNNGRYLHIYNISDNSWTTSLIAPHSSPGGVLLYLYQSVWADNDTIWCIVSGYDGGTWYGKYYKYAVTANTWAQYTNYALHTFLNASCITINTVGTILYVGEVGGNKYSGQKYIIATDTYSLFSIGSTYRFYGTTDRVAKLWIWASGVGIKYYNCDTEATSDVVIPVDASRNKTSNLTCGIYGVGYIIAHHITSEPKNRSYRLPFATAAPSVTTQAVTDKAETTATGNGNVTSRGFPFATQHGHVWTTHTLPTTDDDKTTKGAPGATGDYTSNLTALVQDTLYYCRAYITNSVGTFYGAEVTFTTLSDTPVVTTNSATEVATTTALGNGSIDNNGGSAITEFGVCWVDDATYDSGSHPPTTADDKTTEVATNGATPIIGAFSSLMTGLSAETLYYYRAYAVNSDGTGYGDDVTFTTPIVGAPIVVTRRTINVRSTTATGVGNIIDLGGVPVTQYGHCWDETENPTITDSSSGKWGKTENYTSGTVSVGAFASEITGLTDGTTYYIRAYATNSYGTAYGNNDTIYPTSVWGQTRGHLTVLGEHIAYTSRSGKQRAAMFPEF